MSYGVGISSPLVNPEMAKLLERATNKVAQNTIIFLIIVAFFVHCKIMRRTKANYVRRKIRSYSLGKKQNRKCVILNTL